MNMKTADISRVLVIGPELRGRVQRVFAGVPGIEVKLADLPLGVDTGQFRLVDREERRRVIARLGDRAARLPGGKPPGHVKALRDALDDGISVDGLRDAIAAAEPYDLKCPDRDLAAKL